MKQYIKTKYGPARPGYVVELDFSKIPTYHKYHRFYQIEFTLDTFHTSAELDISKVIKYIQLESNEFLVGKIYGTMLHDLKLLEGLTESNYFTYNTTNHFSFRLPLEQPIYYKENSTLEITRLTIELDHAPINDIWICVY